MTEPELNAAIRVDKDRLSQLEAEIGPLKRRLFAATTYNHVPSAEDFARGHAAADEIRAQLNPLLEEQYQTRNRKAACHAKLDYLRRYGNALVRRGVARGEKVVLA